VKEPEFNTTYENIEALKTALGIVVRVSEVKAPEFDTTGARQRALTRAGVAVAVAVVVLLIALWVENRIENPAPAPASAPTPAPAAIPDVAGAVVLPAPATSSLPLEALVATEPAPVPEQPAVVDEHAGEKPPQAAEPGHPPLADGYLVQLGVFGAMDNAETLRKNVAMRDLPVHIESRVVVGPFSDKAEAEAIREQLRRDGVVEGIVVPPRKGLPSALPPVVAASPPKARKPKTPAAKPAREQKRRQGNGPVRGRAD
jgi:DedD protein